MNCHGCRADKLSKEFPHEHLTEYCKLEHPILHCLKCATKSVKDKNKCSQCDAHVTEDNPNYKKYVQTLEFLFPPIATNDELTNVDANNPSVAADENSKVVSSSQLATVREFIGATADNSQPGIVITTLVGESIRIVYDPDLTVFKLKEFVEEKFQIPLNKQCLLYNNMELEISHEIDLKKIRYRKLREYGVKPNNKIYLVILLCAITEELKKVIFRIDWEYPYRNVFFEFLGFKWFRIRDYLDASVFLYKGVELLEVVDCNNLASTSFTGAVEHTGDKMEDYKKRGHHKITVNIELIPPEVNRLVFTLSARNSPDVSKYLKPCLKFYNVGDLDKKKLCEDEDMKINFTSKAVVMCCLTNRGDKWRVVSLNYECKDNSLKTRDLLKKNIEELIKSGGML